MYKDIRQSGYAPPVWKRAQVQGLKKSRLTIRGDEDRSLVSSEEVWYGTIGKVFSKRWRMPNMSFRFSKKESFVQFRQSLVFLSELHVIMDWNATPLPLIYLVWAHAGKLTVGKGAVSNGSFEFQLYSNSNVIFGAAITHNIFWNQRATKALLLMIIFYKSRLKQLQYVSALYLHDGDSVSISTCIV